MYFSKNILHYDRNKLSGLSFITGRIRFIGLILFICSGILYPQASIQYKTLTLDSLESFSKGHPEYPDILNEIAQRYLEKNTVHSRRHAANMIRKAIDLSPKNIPFRITLIRILNAQGYHDAARRESKKLINNIPDQLTHALSLAEACYYAGYTCELEGLRYLNMKSNPGSGEQALNDHVELNLSKYAHQSFKEAGTYYEKAITLNLRHLEAHQRLIMLYYEIKSYPMMIRLADQLKTLYPRDAMTFALSGLAHYAGGQYMQADQDYRRALELMDENQAMGYYSIGYIVESDQTGDYKTAKQNYETRVPWIERFWNRKDPVYGTPYNERQLEHYNRITYANWRFGVRFQNLDGWKTERGMIYIRYGKPPEQFRIQPDDRTLGGWEVWIYPRHTFYFRDEAASGKFLLDNRSMITLSSAYRESADKFNFPYPEIPLNSKTYQFRSDKGLTDLWFYTATDSSSCRLQLDHGDSITFRGFLLDTLYKTILSREVRFNSRSFNSFGTMLFNAFPLSPVPADTISHPYAVEVEWPLRRFLSTHRGYTRLSSYSSDTLTISEIVLCETPSSQHRASLIPKMDTTLDRGKPVYLYFEIYYLTLNQQGKADYSITTRLRPSQNRSLFGELQEWLNKNQKSDVSQSFLVTANSRFDNYSLGIDISDIPAGDYDLNVSVIDRNSAKTTQRMIRVSIEE